MDYRGVLHRDGSVFSTITPKDLKNPDLMYRGLGFKTAVGMPFKDIATSDSLILTEAPEMDDDVARTAIRRMQEVGVGMLLDAAELEAKPVPNAVAIMPVADVLAGKAAPDCAGRVAAVLDGSETEEQIVALKGLDDASKPVVIILDVPAKLSRLHASRRVIELLRKNEVALPTVHRYYVANEDTNNLALELGVAVGSLLVDGLGEGVAIGNAPGFNFDLDFLRTTSFGLLQGSRMRNTKTEFVSCPSCGRTLFDLQEVTAQISERTGHLPGVAIAIMGCIVNGPGEMADADFGSVGGAPGKVDLYVGKEVIRRGIPNEEACDGLIELIKEYGMWKEKEEEEVLDEELVAA